MTEDRRENEGVEIEIQEDEAAAEEAADSASDSRDPRKATDSDPEAGKGEGKTAAGPDPGTAEGEDKPEQGSDPSGEPEDKEAPEGKDTDQEEDQDMSEKYMRLAADFQNFRRRTEKEKSDIYAYANQQIMTQLLEVLDNFERALDTETEDKGLLQGMELIFQQLSGVLTGSGLEEIEALGKDFDPNFHNAVLTGDDPDYESGKVTEVMQKGYTLNGRVIRPSMVKVNN